MKKKFLSAILTTLLMTGCGGSDSAETSSVLSETSVTPPTTTYAKIEYEIDSSKPMIALTFDDGPNTTTTVQVLNLLEKYGVTASFFLIGNNINDNTDDVVLRAYQMGCEINNHSMSHGYMNRMESAEIIEEVQTVSDKVEGITGEPTRFFRPPYIATSESMYTNIDMPFICGIGCNDWDNNVSVQERIDIITSQVQDGTIILLHDGDGNLKTVTALHTIIPTLLDEGYQFVTVSELFEAKGVEISPDDTNIYSILQ